MESICEEKEKLAQELEASKDEYEKVKKAMEDLTLALHGCRISRGLKQGLAEVKELVAIRGNVMSEMKCRKCNV
jgi:hypothetical protein